MSMTTLLTLSSMFSALSNITPPISYTSKLDIWMVACITFVFGTLFEFTIVIFLKYYLNNLPPVQFEVNLTFFSLFQWLIFFFQIFSSKSGSSTPNSLNGSGDQSEKPATAISTIEDLSSRIHSWFRSGIPGAGKKNVIRISSSDLNRARLNQTLRREGLLSGKHSKGIVVTSLENKDSLRKPTAHRRLQRASTQEVESGINSNVTEMNNTLSRHSTLNQPVFHNLTHNI